VNRTALLAALVLLIVLLATAGWTIDAVHAGRRALRLERA
jgi:hypothetical protein